MLLIATEPRNGSAGAAYTLDATCTSPVSRGTVKAGMVTNDR
jgi:hypothetical protein